MHRKSALFLACLLCAGHGRRLPPSALQSPSRQFEEGPRSGSPVGAGEAFRRLKSLALFLLASDATAYVPLRPGSTLRISDPATLGALATSIAATRRAQPSALQEGEEEKKPAGMLAAAGTTLEQALGALPEGEKYNAVLVSLLSKREAQEGGQTAIELVAEMSSKRIKLSPEALKALLDSAVESGNVEDILETLNVARKNGVCRQFATPQLRLPNKPTQPVQAEVPSDSRDLEVLVAIAFCLGAGGLFLDETVGVVDFLLPGLDIDAPPLQVVLGGLALSWGTDRYLLQGKIFGVIGRGLTRLFQRDLQRECASESASFLLGYLLGLPCCPFAPTAFKPIDMLSDVGRELEESVGTQARLIDRMLIWLLAPTALEAQQYGDLLQADPGLAATFLSAARRREATIGIDVTQGGWSVDDDKQRIQWAYSEARKLLQRYSRVREELQESMAAGVSVGSSINLVEEKLKNSWASV